MKTDSIKSIGGITYSLIGLGLGFAVVMTGAFLSINQADQGVDIEARSLISFKDTPSGVLIALMGLMIVIVTRPARHRKKCPA